MVVRLNDIQQAFDALLRNEKSRDEIDRWAAELMRANDREELLYQPPHEQERIWEAITFLNGIDLPGNTREDFLLSEEDIVAFRNKLNI